MCPLKGLLSANPRQWAQYHTIPHPDRPLWLNGTLHFSCRWSTFVEIYAVVKPVQSFFKFCTFCMLPAFIEKYCALAHLWLCHVLCTLGCSFGWGLPFYFVSSAVDIQNTEHYTKQKQELHVIFLL